VQNKDLHEKLAVPGWGAQKLLACAIDFVILMVR
jgi:hypothetical protein